MVHVAPPDAGRGRRRVPRRRAGLARVRALGPAAVPGGGVVRRPSRGSPRHPGRPLRPPRHSLWQRILEPCQPMILLFDTPTALVVLRVWASISFTTLPEGFYILHWREPGRAEADFGRYDVKRVVRTIYILFSRSEIPIAKEHQEIMDLADLLSSLPEWFTEEDLAVYASLYKKSGFRYPLEMPYRSPQEVTNGRSKVPSPGVCCHWGERLRLQVPWGRGRSERRHYGEARTGPEDHLHP